MVEISGLSGPGSPLEKGAGSPPVSPRRSPEDLGAAAHKFEALLLGQLLRTVRREAWEGEGSATSLLEMAQDQLAELLASRGGLGLARTIIEQLSGPEAVRSLNLAATPNPDKGRER